MRAMKAEKNDKERRISVCGKGRAQICDFVTCVADLNPLDRIWRL